MNIQAISFSKEQEPSWQQMTTGCWQHVKDNRRGMSRLHGVTCPMLNIFGCQPGARGNLPRGLQAVIRQATQPWSPSNTNINHSIGTVTVSHFSLSSPLCPGGHRQTLTRRFSFLFGHILRTSTLSVLNRTWFCSQSTGAHLHQLRQLCTAEPVGLRSQFQLLSQKRSGFNSLNACLILFFC